MFNQIAHVSPFPAVINSIIYDYAKPSYMAQLKRCMQVHHKDYKKQYGGLFSDVSFKKFFFTTSYLINETETNAMHDYLYRVNYCRTSDRTKTARDMLKKREAEMQNLIEYYYMLEIYEREKMQTI